MHLRNIQFSYAVLVVALAFLVVAPSACRHNDGFITPPNAIGSPPIAGRLALEPVADCGELRQYFEASWLAALLTQRHYVNCPNCFAVDVPVVGGGAPNASSELASKPSDVSRTNTQEVGVDEADLIKADSAGRLYLLRDHRLHIYNAFPPEELAEIAKLDLEGYAHALYLDESRQRLVAVVQPNTPQGAGLAAWVPGDYRPQTAIVLIDIAEPAQPSVVTRLVIDGHALTSRRVDGRVHLITQSSVELPQALVAEAEFWALVNEYANARLAATSSADIPAAGPAEVLEQQIRTRLHAAWASVNVTTVLPTLTQTQTGMQTRNPLFDCGAVYRPQIAVTPPQLLAVTTFDMDRVAIHAGAVASSGGTVYATRERLYVDQPSFGWWWADNEPPTTAIHAFDIAGVQPTYLATGRIDGHTGSSFNYSEHNGYLRVASNESRFDPARQQATSSNNLFVLKQNGATLDIVGEVRGFGVDERIFSSRFIGDRGYVVTFRQVDPLFAFDLSEPTAPRLAGELAIPGFSSYMHPIDDDHLLTIGRDADVNGRVQGLALQLFDVSDLAHPTLMHKLAYNTGAYSWSEAEYDHHAFTYYAPLRLLALPLNSADRLTGAGFSGFVAFAIHLATGISVRAKIDHGDLAPSSACADPTVVGECPSGIGIPLRAVVMSSAERNLLYTVSTSGMKANDLADPAIPVGSARFPASATPPIAY